MTEVAVVLHRKKTIGGGPDELRERLAHEGVTPQWYEVAKSKKAPAAARLARSIFDSGSRMSGWPLNRRPNSPSWGVSTVGAWRNTP